MPALTHDPLTPNVGSVVSGVDFSSPDAVRASGHELRALLLDRQVLFFRGLEGLAPELQEAFAAVFGQVQPVSELRPDRVETADVEVVHTHGRAYAGTDLWHVDRSWQDTPPSATCLLARQVPDVGGDTLWASMTLALESMEPGLRDYVSGLQCLHSWEAEANKELIGDRYDEMRSKYPPKVRPVVERHPVSGAPILYVNSLYTTKIIGVPQAEGGALLQYLVSLATVPECQVRWRWEPGAMAIWDNWAVQHYAVSDYFPHERVMHRVTVI